jgi:hypothetical protein
MYKCQYFKIQELVSPIVFKTYGEFAWSFFDENLLKDLDSIRELTGSPLIVNGNFRGCSYIESGLRCNMDSIVAIKKQPYLSAHVLGRAFDIKSRKLSSQKLYDFILTNQHKFKAIKRMEDIKKTPTWVHIDSLNTNNNNIAIF